MQTDYARLYAELPHTRDFSPVDANEILAEINGALYERVQKKSCYFVIETDALKLCLTYLSLIDKNCVPVILPPDINETHLNSLKEEFPEAGVIKQGEIVTRPGSILENADHYICLTSGTTGRSKSCFLGIAEAKRNASAHAESFGISSIHQIVQCLPIHHSFGIIAYIWTPLSAGCGVDFMKSFVGLRPFKNATSLEKKVLHISPAQMRFILKDQESGKFSPAVISVGASSTSEAETKKLLEVFPKTQIFTSYGCTELGPRVTTGKITSETLRSGYIGQPIAGVEVKILTQDNVILESGEGILLVKTPSLKKNTSEHELIDGHYITRDVVLLDENKHIYFISRSDDIIKKSGVSIYPLDLEATIRTLSEIRDCLVLKQPHALYEEVPYLIAESDLNVKELFEIIKKTLSPFHWPEKILVTKSFPRTSLGKIDRKKVLEEMNK